MEREGLFIDTRSDKAMTPHLYFNSELWDIRRDEAALFIQRIIRGMLARMRAKNLLTLKEHNKQTKLRQEEEKRKEDEAHQKMDITRRVHPQSKEDFKVLIEELENWRVKEIQKIKSSSALSQEEKQIALKQVLDKVSFGNKRKQNCCKRLTN